MLRIPPRAVLLALAATAACGRGEPRAHSDPAQTIQAAPGSDFRVALTSNRGTGYQWVLVDSGGLGPLRSAGASYEVPRRNRDRDGAGGTETWTFHADSAGDGTISLIYVRPWEPTAPADTTRFRVVVR